ncbi:hypothetical protein ScFU29_03850 [Streptococcus canis]|nr:hypothetical protein ScFU29_03850 [Streptococcus canis]
MKKRGMSKPTVIKTLDELDVKKGIGQIERVRLGLDKPNIIYVKDWTYTINIDTKYVLQYVSEDTKTKGLFYVRF